MLAFTIRNTVLVALAQVGIIVAGVLTSGLAGKLLEGNPNATIPFTIQMLVSYGVFLLALPLAWVTVALLVRRNPRCNDAIKTFAFVSGMALALGLATFFLAVFLRSFR